MCICTRGHALCCVVPFGDFFYPVRPGSMNDDVDGQAVLNWDAGRVSVDSVVLNLNIN